MFSLALALGCGTPGGGEGTPGTAGSTGGDTSAGRGGTTGTAGTGQAGSSQAGTGGSASGGGGASGGGAAGTATGTAGSGSAGTIGTAGTTGTAGYGGAGTAGAGGSSAGSEGRGGAAGGVGGRGGSNAGGGRGGNTGRGGSAGSGGSSGGAAGTGRGGGAGTGAGGSGTPGMSAGCGKAPGIPSSMYNNGSRISITAANIQRRYILNVPTNYDNTRPYKLIIAWHQLDGNDVQMYQNQYYHLLNLSQNSAIFVAPNGQKNGAPCTGTGNGDGGCGWPNPNNQDIALGDAVVAQIQENFCVDTNRIFANGWSYGGAMSYQHSCARPLGASPGYLRGIATYSGSPSITSGPCPPTRPVAYYTAHGTADNVLNYSGGVTMAQNYARANGCTWATPTQATGNHVCTNIAGCMTGYPVRFCSHTGGHTPDPSDGGGGSWNYQEVWNFFNQF